MKNRDFKLGKFITLIRNKRFCRVMNLRVPEPWLTQLIHNLIKQCNINCIILFSFSYHQNQRLKVIHFLWIPCWIWSIKNTSSLIFSLTLLPSYLILPNTIWYTLLYIFTPLTIPACPCCLRPHLPHCLEYEIRSRNNDT